MIAILVATVAIGACAAPGFAQEETTIELEEFEGSGVSGRATLRASGSGTFVSMQLEGEPLTGNHPTHIHTGTCGNFDPNPTFPLTTVVLDEVDEMGVSATTVSDVSLVELLGEDFVILVHESQENLTTYLVCGEIKLAMTVPESGVGSVAHDGGHIWLPVGLAALASALLAAGLLLRVGREAA